jgi:predicted HTH domain antitoxin
MTLTITTPNLEALGLTKADVLLELALGFYTSGKLTLEQASLLVEWEPMVFLETLLASRNPTPEIRRRLAVESYRAGQLTTGQAARIAGLSHLEFRKLFAEEDLYVNYDVEEFERDLANLRERSRWAFSASCSSQREKAWCQPFGLY